MPSLPCQTGPGWSLEVLWSLSSYVSCKGALSSSHSLVSAASMRQWPQLLLAITAALHWMPAFTSLPLSLHSPMKVLFLYLFYRCGEVKSLAPKSQFHCFKLEVMAPTSYTLGLDVIAGLCVPFGLGLGRAGDDSVRVRRATLEIPLSNETGLL